MARAVAFLLLVVPAAGCATVGKGDDPKPTGRSFTVAAAGDILIHPQLTDQAKKDAEATGHGSEGLDFDPMMAGVKPVISKADLAICHFEAVAGEPKGPFQNFPDFVVPPQIATSIKNVGYDTCSTASNHTLDHGEAGVRRTLNTLDKAGLKHTGSARSAEEAAKPLIMDVKGVKVAHIAFATGFNGREVPKDKLWLANEIKLKDIAAAEKAARAAGAEVVILSIHWGREHWPNPSTSQLKLARDIARETGINLVIGHHAHVVQPMEKVGGTWFAYSLGNELARHDVPTGLSEEGIIGWFEFAERGGAWDVQARYVPTLVDIPPTAESVAEVEADDDDGGVDDGDTSDYRLVDVVAALRDDKNLTDKQRARYRVAFERTRGTMLNRGAAKDGLRPLRDLTD
ncbi:CapA family protein [Streptomyces sp. NPDC088725]|uniref:CapA family protein n=1 Tax=Streptomyces sp. NPDC088725 TaxID=3365873 RepID=UPI0037FB70E6